MQETCQENLPSIRSGTVSKGGSARLARIGSVALDGIETLPIEVEIRVKRGPPSFSIIGLGDAAVRESRERVLSALRASGYLAPSQILANLAPAEVRKEGSQYDLPIAVGILVASGQVPRERLEGLAVFGELSLDGRVKGIRGALALAMFLRDKGVKVLIAPAANSRELSIVPGLRQVPCSSLRQVVDYLRGAINAQPMREIETAPSASSPIDPLLDVFGQQNAKRALTVAAAGGHNVL